MRRAFLASELDTTAGWWRIYRCDGVTLGFTTHDRDLWFDGIVTAPRRACCHRPFA